MNYSECINAVSLVLESNEVPLIIGESGIGKTSLIKHIARDNGYYLVTIDANLLKEGEIGGLPIVNNNTTVYATHHKLVEIDKILKEYETAQVILFIDELNRCDHSVAQELMNLILNREINGYVLNDRVKVIAAMNPSSRNDGFYNGQYEVVDLDPAQEDRFVWIQLDSVFPQYLHTPDSSETIKATPRSWERVSKSYDIYINNKDKYPFETLLNVVKGNVGSSITNDFSSFIMNLKKPLIKVDDIFENDVLEFELKEKIQKENHSRLYILVKNAVNYLKENNSERNLNLFSELLDLYPRDLRLGIMKEIKRDYRESIYEKLLDNDKFLEAFFNIFK